MPSTIDRIEGDSGVAGDFQTNDTTLTVSGSLEKAIASDERVEISTDGGATWTTATVDGTNWSFEDPTAQDASFTYEARIAGPGDSVGATAEQAVTIDTVVNVAPPVVAVSQDEGVESPDTTDDFVTNVVSPTVSGSATLALDETLQIQVDGGAWVDVVVDAETGAWNYQAVTTETNPDTGEQNDVPLVYANGDAVIFTTRVVDDAGNVSEPVARTITIDTSADTDANAFTVTVDEGFEVTNATESEGVRVTLAGIDADAASVAVTFSDETENTVTADVTQDENGVWTVTATDLSGLADGPITVSAVVTDISGNTADAVVDTLVLDTTPPTLAITNSGGDFDLAVGESTEITFTFSEAPTAFAAENISVDGGSIGVLSDPTTNSDGTVTYTATLTPNADFDGDISIKVADGAYTDSDGNSGVAAELRTIDSSTVTPTLAITNSGGDFDLAVGESTEITFTFSEAPTAFAAENISVDGGSIGVLSDPTTNSDGTVTYTATLTPNADFDGDISIKVADGAYTDSDGNSGVAAELRTIDSSTVTPTLAITNSGGDFDLAVGESTEITFTFSEAPTAFAAENISVDGGSIGVLSDPTTNSDGTVTYTATLTPNADFDGDISIKVADGAYTDSDGNSGVAAELRTIDSSTVTPTLAITNSGGDFDLAVGESTEITFTFSEAPTAFAAENISVDGGSIGVLSDPTTNSDGTVTYTATLTPNADFDGDISIKVADGAYTDSDGNSGVAAELRTIDSSTVTPTLAITNSGGDFDLAVGESTEITFTFSEAPTAFAAENISVDGGSIGVLSDPTTNSDGTVTYTATLTPNADFDGDISIKVADGAYTDSDGNSGVAAELRTIDSSTVTPTLAITNSGGDFDLAVGESTEITFTFSEAPTAFAAENISVDGGSIGVLSDPTTNSDGTVTYTATLTPNADFDGDISIKVADGAYTDSDGNSGVAAELRTIDSSTVTPTLAITNSGGDFDLAVGESTEITFTFSEAPTAFAAENISVDGGSIGVLSDPTTNSDGTVTYTATLTPNADFDGDISIKVADGAYTDSDGNSGVAAELRTIDSSTVTPTLAITNSGGDFDLAVGESTEITFTFSEAPTAFAAENISVDGGSIGVLSDPTTNSDGTVTYTATLTPNADFDGDISIKVADGAYTDSDGNSGVAAELRTIDSSTVTPTLAITNSGGDFDLAVGESTEITFTFSEAPTAFAAENISVDGGSIGVLSDPTTNSDGTVTYTATLTPNADFDGDISIKVADGAYTDSDGNSGVAAELRTIDSSTVTPTLAITNSGGDFDLAVGESTEITFTFSEAPTAFAAENISVDGGSIGVLSDPTTNSDGTVTYTATLTPNADFDGDISIKVADGAYTDSDGNSGVAAELRTIDSSTVTPTLAITNSGGDFDLAVGESTEITFTFSEAPTAFAAENISVDGGSIGVLSDPTTNSDGTVTYTATLTPNADFDGDISIKVADGAYTDSDGNSGVAAELRTIDSSTGANDGETFTIDGNITNKQITTDPPDVSGNAIQTSNSNDVITFQDGKGLQGSKGSALNTAGGDDKVFNLSFVNTGSTIDMGVGNDTLEINGRQHRWIWHYPRWLWNRQTNLGGLQRQQPH